MFLAMVLCGPQSKKRGRLSAANFVELPGIEPDALPSNLASDLTVRFDSVQFSTARHLRFRFGVLRAARVTPVPGHRGSHRCGGPESMPPALYRNERREPPSRGAVEKLARPPGHRRID